MADSGMRAKRKQQTAMVHWVKCRQPPSPIRRLNWTEQRGCLGVPGPAICPFCHQGLSPVPFFMKQNQNHYHQMAFVPSKVCLKLFFKTSFNHIRQESTPGKEARRVCSVTCVCPGAYALGCTCRASSGGEVPGVLLSLSHLLSHEEDEANTR